MSETGPSKKTFTISGKPFFPPKERRKNRVLVCYNYSKRGKKWRNL